MIQKVPKRLKKRVAEKAGGGRRKDDSLNIDVPHLQQRSRSFRFRRAVPDDLRDRVGKREWLHSLGRNEAAAIRACRMHTAKYDALIAHLRGTGANEVVDEEMIAAAEAEARALVAAGEEAIQTAFDNYFNESWNDWLAARVAYRKAGKDAKAPTPAAMPSLSPFHQAVLNAAGNGGRYIPSQVTISEAYQRDVQLYGGDRKDERPVALAVETFTAAVGADVDIRAIRREHVLTWISAQRDKGLGDRTISRRMEALSGIQWRWLRDHELQRSPVWTGHKLKRKEGRKRSRLPFHTTHLDAVETYIASGRSAPVVGRILHLMKALALGPSEAGGIMLADCAEDDPDCPYIWIRENALRGLKTDDTRERMLPLYGPALIAVREAAKEARAAKRTGLFFEPDEFDRNALSARLNKALRAAGIANSIRLTAYSYRHTMTEALKLKKTPRELRLYIEGHAGSGASEEDYGSALPMLPEMKAALEDAMTALGKVNLLQYTEEEKKIAPTKGRSR